MNITILGAGAWGTALAVSLAAEHHVSLWARNAEQILAMSTAHCNELYLPDVPLPVNLLLSPDLASSVSNAQLLIVAVPASGLRETLERLIALKIDLPGLVWLCKGFEAQSALLPHQVAAQILPENLPCGVLSGPSFAAEVARGLPTALVLASGNETFAQRMSHELHHPKLRVYASCDVTGVEVGGAVKNVMAIAAGVCDGLQLGNNARAALITRGLAEMTRLGLKLGGRQETLGGLSGAGDLILTCTGDLSRNRTVGLLMAKNLRLDDILLKLGHVAEGVYAVREVHRLAARLKVNMPISEAVYQVLYEGVNAAEMVNQLLNRTTSLEFDA
jgi:glycerol-3-phosphate dehydrogenase (NAD(P)+)